MILYFALTFIQRQFYSMYVNLVDKSRPKIKSASRKHRVVRFEKFYARSGFIVLGPKEPGPQHEP